MERGSAGSCGARSAPTSAPGPPVPALALFARDPATGALLFDGIWRDGQSGIEGLNGASYVAFGRRGARVFAVGSEGDSVAVFERDPATEEIRFRGAIVEECGASGLGGAIRLAASADGRHVYLAGSFVATVAIFAPEPGSTMLAAVAALTLGALARRRLATAR